MNKAYLILGSNIQPEVNIPRALGLLARSFNLVAVSDTWRTKAVGSNADDFFNTAVEIETGLDKEMLKERCLCHIEEIMGRVRQKDKNAPRTIDIDIVVFNEQILENAIFSAEHLALPLAELFPNLKNPQNRSTLKETAAKIEQSGSAARVGRILPPK